MREGSVQLDYGDGVARKTQRCARSTYYVLPSGYKIRLREAAGGHSVAPGRLAAHGTLCHKPCTVSGGGKSEISKSIANIMLKGPVFVRDYQRDMDTGCRRS